MSDDPTQQACTLALDHDEEFSGNELKKGVWAILKSLNPSYPDYQLTLDESTFGRHPTSTFHFNDKNISGLHCTIKKESSDNDEGPIIAFIMDQSTNGTFMDGIKIGKGNRCLLTSGQEIALYLNKKQIQDKISFIYQAVEKEIEEEGGPQKKYLVGETLGAGNFATVKLAVDKKTGAKFAIKIIDKKKYFMNSSTRKDALMDEVNILMGLNHPNIIHIQEIFDTTKTLYLVLELVECGELLNDILSNAFYPEAKAKAFFKQIVNGVLYLHNQGIAHRDLKPENILLKNKKPDAPDSIKLSDFGLSRTIGEGSFMKTMCGTPQYLAPEILTNGANGASGYGKEVDCWSLGAILYVMLCGYPPFDESKDISIFEQIRGGIYEFSEDDWSGVSEEAKDLIKRLLNVNPSKRYTCQQILNHPWYNSQLKLDDLLKSEQLQQLQKQSSSPSLSSTTTSTTSTSSNIDVNINNNNNKTLGKRKSDDGIITTSFNSGSFNNNNVCTNSSNNNNNNHDTVTTPTVKKSKNTIVNDNDDKSSKIDSSSQDDSDTDEDDDETQPINPSNINGSSPPPPLTKQTTPTTLSSKLAPMNISSPSPPAPQQSNPQQQQPHINNKTNNNNVFATPLPKQPSPNLQSQQQQQQQAPSSPTSALPMCMYGEKCYRKNPDHLRKYSHPPKTN
eukprot:gene5918-7367_t